MSRTHVKPTLAEQLKLLVNSREGRKYLECHSWVPGMPIVTGVLSEPISETMGLVSTRPGPSLVAVEEPLTEELRLLYVSEPSRALLVVPPVSARMTLWELFESARRLCLVTFRIPQWKYSAVAHELPAFRLSQLECKGLYRHELLLEQQTLQLS